MAANSVSAGIPVTLIQNVVYALPARACYLSTSVAVEVAVAEAGAWAAPAAGVPTAANFIRCTTGNALVTAKTP